MRVHTYGLIRLGSVCQFDKTTILRKEFARVLELYAKQVGRQVAVPRHMPYDLPA